MLRCCRAVGRLIIAPTPAARARSALHALQREQKARAVLSTKRRQSNATTITWRRSGRSVLIEVRIGQSGKFTVDRERLRSWLADKIRTTYLMSWDAEEAQVTSRYASFNALNFFEDRLHSALVATINALAAGAIIKALDDWKGQVITVSTEKSLRVPALDDLKRKGRDNVLESVEKAWREILDFRGKGGVYRDDSKEHRYREVYRFWTAKHQQLADSGVDDQVARRQANIKTMAHFKIKSYSTLAAWRKAGSKLP